MPYAPPGANGAKPLAFDGGRAAHAPEPYGATDETAPTRAVSVALPGPRPVIVKRVSVIVLSAALAGTTAMKSAGAPLASSVASMAMEAVGGMACG